MTTKFKAGETTGTYIANAPLTEHDILTMAKHLASQKLRKGHALHHPTEVFSYSYRSMSTRYSPYCWSTTNIVSFNFKSCFAPPLDGASVYPREVVKLALAHNAAAVILVHNHPSGDPAPNQADRVLTTILKQALELVSIRTLDHIVVGSEGCVSLTELGCL